MPRSMEPRRRMPAVSISVIGSPSSWTSVSMGSRVVPGTADTIIRSWPSTLLMKVDLPVLGRPTMATLDGPISIGQLGEVVLGELRVGNDVRRRRQAVDDRVRQVAGVAAVLRADGDGRPKPRA